MKFTGNSDEYTIVEEGHTVVVSDNLNERDGVNTLIDIEKVEFIDRVLEL